MTLTPKSETKRAKRFSSRSSSLGKPHKHTCKHCKGIGLEPNEETGLSCFECNGMGEIYEED